MSQGNFITAYRSLQKNKTHSILNLLGLTLGVTSCLFIFLVIRYELSFDTFHKKSDRIYRITTDMFLGTTDYVQSASYPVGAAVKDEFPEVEALSTVYFENEGIVKASNQIYKETGIAYLSPAFFDIFDFGWLVGSPEQSLTAPNSVVLTESVARRYFSLKKSDDLSLSLGKVVRLNNAADFTVAGVTRDFPENTDFPFKILLSLSTLKPSDRREMTDWITLNWSVNHYVLLKQGVDAEKVNAQFPGFQKKHMSADEATKRAMKLQPLNDIHFNDQYGNWNNRTVTRSTILVLSLIGILLLVTACINFINLATAQSVKRSKEVGVRKVLGADKTQLIRNFMSETVLIVLTAIVAALVAAFIFFPTILKLLDMRIESHWFADPLLPVFLVGLLVFVSVLAGLYPSLVLTGFNPISALKGKVSGSRSSGNIGMRRGLIIFQFVVSQVLVIGTFVVAKQLELFRSQPLGFDKEAIVTLAMPESNVGQRQSLRNQLLEVPGVQRVSYCLNNPSSDGNWRGVFNFPGSGADDIPIVMRPADPEYINTYGLTLLAGKNLSETDNLETGIIVNEKVLRLMNIANPEEAIGKQVTTFGRGTTIVGVVKDFHAYTLHQEIPPVLLFNDPNGARLAALKFNTVDLKNTLSKIEHTYKSIFPESVFEYQFLDDTIASFYREEQKLSHIFTIFSGIAIFIGCLGLFGLISFVSLQRTKEIGVRKVNGAKLIEILALLNRDFALWIAIAFVIACPVAWYIMNTWLQKFAYRTELNWWIFALAGVSAMAIALLTVSWQSYKAASTNPVDALRYE